MKGADEREVTEAFEQAKGMFGRVDILFNNAGIADPVPAPVHQYETAHWHQVMNVDLHGVFYCAKSALQTMVEQGSGKIVNIASMWGMAGASSIFPIPAYNAAKGALVNLTRELGLKYAPGTMPTIYLSHGAPPLTDDAIWPGQLAAWSAELPTPAAIIVVSAHWENAPITLGATSTVDLTYDLWGFPQRYYEVAYPALGHPR